MPMKVLIAALLIGSMPALSPPVTGAQVAPAGDTENRYEVAGITSAAAAEGFFYRLQRAVAQERRAEVAALVDYPVRVRLGRRMRRVRNRAELLRRYPLVFNRRVKRALAQQKTESLFVNWRGVMVGRGEIWFNEMPYGGRFRIIAINN